MGGGKGGDFGETKGSFGISADDISNLLALMSIVPGLDIITNLLSIPVDLYRSDYFSALLDLVGVLPIAGEVGDAAKLGDKAVDASKAIKAADKAADAVKVAKNNTDFLNYPKKIHVGRQGKHILGHNNYKKGKSILGISVEKTQDLVNKYSGTGKKLGPNRERVNFKEIIGEYVDPKTGKVYKTTMGTIHYSKDGTHIVPEKPVEWRK